MCRAIGEKVLTANSKTVGKMHAKHIETKMQYDNETATEALNGTEPAFCISHTQPKVGDFCFMPYRATQSLHSENIHTTLESCLVYNFLSMTLNLKLTTNK